jgi:phosphatidate phosphatase APP1
LKELLFKNPHTRSIFPDVEKHYSLLAKAHTTPEAPNPFFYVSSSEWNLYDYLRDLFTFQKLPNGVFLLNQFKRWKDVWKTGKTKHEGKLLRILRVFEVFPKQRFVLMGDSSQSDPAIYSKLVEKYGSRIFAVYIRNVSGKKEASARELLSAISKKGIHVLLFKESSEAIVHSKQIGLI